MFKLVYIGNIAIGGYPDYPKISAVIGRATASNALELLKSAKQEGADIAEMRIDLFESYDKPSVIELFNRIHNNRYLPLIVTIRRLEDKGLFFDTEEKRYELFNAIMDYADAIDIELKAEIRDKVIEEAKKKNVTTIVSYHDYEKTPPYHDLESLVERAYETDADLIKIAVLANSDRDMLTLFRFMYNYKKDKPLIMISMGETGKISRIIFPLFGSCITYGFMDKASAPGQMRVKHMRYILDKMIPKKQEILEHIQQAYPIITKPIC